MLGKSSNSRQSKKVIRKYKKLLTNKHGCGNIYSQGRYTINCLEAMRYENLQGYNKKPND